MRPISFLRLTTALMAVGLVVSQSSRGAANSTAASGSAPAAAKSAASAGAAASGKTETAASSNVSTNKVSVTFKTVAINSPVKNVYFVNNNVVTPLSAQAAAPSTNSYTYSGNATMELLRPGAGGEAPAPEPANGSARGGRGNRIPSGPMNPVGAVTFPKSGNYMLYMADGGESVSAAALSTDTAQFPMGSMRVVNGTKYPMEIKINEAFLPLKPFDSMLLPIKGEEQFILLVQRTDTDPHSGVIGSPVSKPSPGMRTTALIMVGNAAQVLKDHAEPNFNPFFINDTGVERTPAARAGGTAGGRGTGGGQGGGSGRNRRGTGG